MALWRIRATVDDRPGFLAVLTASLALRSVNILAVQVHTTEAGAVDDFLVDAPDTMTEDDLVAAVEKGRGRNAWVSRAQAQGLVDAPTQALALATRLARDPDALGEGLRHLLGGEFRVGAGSDGVSVVWRPARNDEFRYGFDGGTMRLPDPRGGAYEVSRTGPEFTPAEYARAQALVELVRAAGQRPGQRRARPHAGRNRPAQVHRTRWRRTHRVAAPGNPFRTKSPARSGHLDTEVLNRAPSQPRGSSCQASTRGFD